MLYLVTLWIVFLKKNKEENKMEKKVTITKDELIGIMSSITAEDDAITELSTEMALFLVLRDAVKCSKLVEKLFGKEDK